MYRSISIILVGNVFSAIALMVRNLMVARLISVEDYGIASTFLLAVALVEMLSALGLQQQLIQSKRGDEPEFQAALQFLNLLKAIVSAAALFLLARPLAEYFSAPQAAWTYQLIALVPLLFGFKHFDTDRLSRQMSFMPMALMNAVPPLCSLVLVWPLYLMFGDYRILLYAILVQALLTVTISHLVAKRAFRMRADWSVLRDSLSFGWPLLLNSGLMFAVLYGERIIVGGQLGLEPLALFAMGFSLALAPAILMANSASSFFLPQLSATSDPQDFSTQAMAVIQAHIFMGCFLLVALAIIGGPFIHAVLSEKYAPIVPLLTWLGVTQAVRVWKTGGSVVAMARAHTENAIATNITRVSFLPLAWYMLEQGGSLVQVIWIGLAGEMIGFVLGLALALWRLTLPLRPLVLPICIGLGVLFLGGWHAERQGTDWIPDPLTSALLIFGLIALFVASVDLRTHLTKRN